MAIKNGGLVTNFRVSRSVIATQSFEWCSYMYQYAMLDTHERLLIFSAFGADVVNLGEQMAGISQGM